MKLSDLKIIMEQVSDDELQMFAQEVKTKLGLEELDLSLNKDGGIRLDLIQVPKNARKAGLGSQAMDLLTQFADAHGVRISLTTAQHDPRFGTTSRTRLTKFYKRFGFVPNKGRYKDFSLSMFDNMYRHAKKK